jgi:hypothetical protein
MTRQVLLLVLSALCVTSWGCAASTSKERAAGEATRAYRTILNYLECEECTQGELQAVTQLGRQAVPTLVACLNKGPSQANRELLRQHLVTTYGQLKSYAKTHPEAEISLTEKEYVDTYMDNYVALYQARAATALAAIGGPAAKEALANALRAPIREDVKTSVRDSLNVLNKKG